MLAFWMISAGCLLAVNAQNVPNYPDNDAVCPPLHVHQGITVIPPTCTTSKMRVGDMCTFSCPDGFRVHGPPMKECVDGGTWTNNQMNISCTDINECRVNNGGCGDKCINLVGSHRCECPSHLTLAEDGMRCKAEGLKLTCKANHNKTHYILETSLTGCGTTSRQVKNYIVYSNKVSEEPDRSSDKIGRVLPGEVQVPFCCYFHNKEIVHAVGMRPYSKKVYIRVKGRGQYQIKFDFYKGTGYGGRSSGSVYTWDDFPVSVHLRQRLYFEVSLVTKEKDLKIFADKCCSTPTRDHEKSRYLRHTFINNGCPVDKTVRMHSSPSHTKQRFSVEAFKFLGDHPFVFVHCHVRVCEVGDKNSRCKADCKNGGHKVSPIKVHPILHTKKHTKTKRAVSVKEGVTVTRGPFVLDQRKQHKMRDSSKLRKRHKKIKPSFDESEKQNTKTLNHGLSNISHVALVAMTVAAAMALVGVMYFGFKSKQLAPVGYDHVSTKSDLNL